MPESHQNNRNGGEEVALRQVPGTGVEQSDETCTEVICISKEPTLSCRNDKYHRKLAIASIVCGFSCCGVPALVYSVKAEDADKAEKAEQTTDKRAAKYLSKAKKLGLCSIVTWVGLLLLAPVMVELISYLFTLGD